jgi:tight adherence protein B
VLASVLLAIVPFLVVMLLLDTFWSALLVGALFGCVPYWYVRFAATRRLNKLEEQFPEAADLIASSLRAGHAFPAALRAVSEELPDPLGAEFRVLYDQQNFGKPLPDVLKDFAERIPLLDTRIFVTAVLTQRETGGNLAEVLDNLSAVIRDRFKIRRHVRAASAHGRVTGWVLSMLPPVVAGVLYVIAPEHLRVLIDDPIGLQLTAFAIFLQVAGVLAVRRIVNIEL